MNKQLFLYLSIFFSQQCFGQKKITIKFEHVVNGKKIVLHDGMYTNAWGEQYNITKLKYYVSNITFTTKGQREIGEEIYLIDAAKEDAITKIDGRKIVGISFTIGVDSALNCSGAQSGALDPLNDMFWTWNNGYVFFKLEGTSAASAADRNRIEHHIGGYKGEYKAQRRVYLSINKINNLITIQVDIDKYWQGVKIAENPVIAAPGKQAKAVADRLVGMFSIKS